jgi:hypothetical protein
MIFDQSRSTCILGLIPIDIISWNNNLQAYGMITLLVLVFLHKLHI